MEVKRKMLQTAELPALEFKHVALASKKLCEDLKLVRAKLFWMQHGSKRGKSEPHIGFNSRDAVVAGSCLSWLEA